MRDNERLNQLEYRQHRLYLRSFPRCLGLVLGNTCNIDCPHCYQAKNGDNLLKPPAIGRELRREFAAFYPHLTTLRIQGGEAFAYSGFRDILEDVRDTAGHPILSVSTNGTLIDEEWAEAIVRTPFRTMTVSIDGGTRETYARLRRGADLGEVLANVDRIRRWKTKLASDLPYLDTFFVVMRSNFREIPQYFQIAAEHGFGDVSLQTMSITAENTAREPNLVRDESIVDRGEIVELHGILRDLMPRERGRFRMIRTSGLTSLFEEQGLDAGFLSEQTDGLYPDAPSLEERGEIELCPNPWTTLFVTENGNVHLCFLAEPIGNLYEAPLAAIWNSPQAMAKRSDMTSGRYLRSGCSQQWCGWREGKKAAAPEGAEFAALRAEMRDLVERAKATGGLVQIGEAQPNIAAVRRTVAERDRQVRELEALFARLCEVNGEIHERGQRYIDQLEKRLGWLAVGDALGRAAATLLSMPGRLRKGWHASR